MSKNRFQHLVKKTWIPFLCDVRYQKLDVVLLLLAEDPLTKKINLCVQSHAQYLTLRDSPCGGTSKGATVAVTTRVEFRYKFEKILLFVSICSGTPRVVTATVAVFDVPPEGLSRNITTCLQVFDSDRHI
jgi:hypothetical protein